MKLIWQCMFSPRLYRVYKDGPKDSLYQAEGLEKWGDKFISTANTLWNISVYTSPFIIMYMCKRGFFTMDEMKMLGHFFGGFACMLAFAFLVRAYGRTSNPKYVQFVTALKNPATDKNIQLTELRKYDFDIKAWPTAFTVASKAESSSDNDIIKMAPIYVGSSWWDFHPFKYCANPELPMYKRVIFQTLGFFATHTFALRLIYPGSLGVVHTLLWAALFQGRNTLVEEHDGKRAKIRTADGNLIDTMFVDNRLRSVKGRTLVICCEGNSGFYEIGIISTPIKSGYSALGWNHPGFAGSTGKPYPAQEHNAMDAVMQYAINELGFKPHRIVLFGWSIGGYTATWAAVNYPVGALVLDATFDDLLPLAQNQMPPSWELLVKEVIRSYVDLHISKLISKYEGPVQLVRRTEDEIISLRQGILSTNRGNDLLIELIEQRHPAALENPVARDALVKMLALSDNQRSALERGQMEEHGRRLLPLIAKYLHDYKSSHCTPLPESNFVSIMDRLEAEKQG